MVSGMWIIANSAKSLQEVYLPNSKMTSVRLTDSPYSMYSASRRSEGDSDSEGTSEEALMITSTTANILRHRQKTGPVGCLAHCNRMAPWIVAPVLQEGILTYIKKYQNCSRKTKPWREELLVLHLPPCPEETGSYEWNCQGPFDLYKVKTDNKSHWRDHGN